MININHVKKLTCLCENLPESELIELNNGLLKFFQKHPMSDEIVNEINRIHGVVGGMSGDEILDYGAKSLAGIVAIGLIGWFLHYWFNERRTIEPAYEEHIGLAAHEDLEDLEYLKDLEYLEYLEASAEISGPNTITLKSELDKNDCLYSTISGKSQLFLDKLIFETGVEEPQATIEIIYNENEKNRITINAGNNTYRMTSVNSFSLNTSRIYTMHDMSNLYVIVYDIQTDEDIEKMHEELVSIGCNVPELKHIKDKTYFSKYYFDLSTLLDSLCREDKLKIINNVKSQIRKLIGSDEKYLDIALKLNLKSILYKCTEDRHTIEIFLDLLPLVIKKSENPNKENRFNSDEVKKEIWRRLYRLVMRRF